MILLSHDSSGFFFLSVSFPVEFGTHPEESMSLEILNVKEERYKKYERSGVCFSSPLFGREFLSTKWLENPSE
jgi:hypothetical protein